MGEPHDVGNSSDDSRLQGHSLLTGRCFATELWYICYKSQDARISETDEQQSCHELYTLSL